jgi:hypothetical protein
VDTAAVYFDAGGVPQYAPSIVVFTDAMGVRSRSTNRDALLDAYEAVRTHLLLGGQDSFARDSRVGSFSDSTVLTEPVTSALPAQLLRVIKQTAQYQLAHFLCSEV